MRAQGQPIAYGRVPRQLGRVVTTQLVALYRESTMQILGRRTFLVRRFEGGRVQRWRSSVAWIDAQLVTMAPAGFRPIVQAPAL